jgi:catalase
MASSSHNSQNARTPSAAAGSSDAGQDQAGESPTTTQGLRLPDTDHSLKAGERGPTPLEDFHLREKITPFDHERIPSVAFMPVAPRRTASSSRTAPAGR